MSAVNAAYLFAQTLNGNICYTCTGICSWSSMTSTGIAGAFWLESTGNVCFYINDGFTKTIRNISAVSMGGFIHAEGTDDMTVLMKAADIDNIKTTGSFGGLVSSYLEGDLTFSLVNSDVDNVSAKTHAGFFYA